MKILGLVLGLSLSALWPFSSLHAAARWAGASSTGRAQLERVILRVNANDSKRFWEVLGLSRDAATEGPVDQVFERYVHDADLLHPESVKAHAPDLRAAAEMANRRLLFALLRANYHRFASVIMPVFSLDDDQIQLRDAHKPNFLPRRAYFELRRLALTDWFAQLETIAAGDRRTLEHQLLYHLESASRRIPQAEIDNFINVLVSRSELIHQQTIDRDELLANVIASDRTSSAAIGDNNGARTAFLATELALSEIRRNGGRRSYWELKKTRAFLELRRPLSFRDSPLRTGVNHTIESLEQSTGVTRVYDPALMLVQSCRTLLSAILPL